MNWERKTIIIESVVILLLIAGCIGLYAFYHNPKIVYQWKEGVTKTVYVKAPTDDAEYLGCYKSPVWIGGTQKGSDFIVEAGDDCKRASRKLTVKTDIYHHMPMLSYTALYNIEARQFRHGINGMYFYNFGPVALGGGAFAVFDKSKLYDIGPTVGIAGFFK